MGLTEKTMTSGVLPEPGELQAHSQDDPDLEILSFFGLH